MGEGARPASERVVDGACAVFAVWTVCIHAVVAAGGSLHHAMLGFAALGGALAVAWWRWPPAAPGPEAAPPPEASDPAWARPLQVGLLLLAAAAAFAFAGELVAWWWSAVAVLGVAGVAFVAREAPRFEAPARGRGLEAGLLALAAVCVVVTLVAHRFDLDDAFYINLAAAAADAPGDAILVEDTLHGVPGLPLHLSVYRLHSYEMWNGALAALTGLPAIVCFHWVSATLGAVLAVLALARLTRWLTPRHWLWTTAACVFVLLSVGGLHRWYGNFAFVRMWQGKGLMIFVFLPLAQAYAIELARRPTLAGWLRLAAAQVAAVGCSSSALWAGPAAALAAAACAVRPTPAGVRALALVLLSSAYVLGAGWVAREAIRADFSASWRAELTPEVERVRRERPALDRHRPGAELEIAATLVVGESRLRLAFLLALAGAWAFCAPGLGRRYAVVVPLAVTLVLLDPYTTRFVTGNVTGGSFWRSFWILPVPLLLAMLLTSPLRLRRGAPWLGRVGALAAVAAFAVAVPTTTGLSEENRVELSWPTLKVPWESYRWAEILTDRLEPGAAVVAPGDVCPWLVVFPDRVQPLIVRPPYLRGYVEQLGAEDLQLRLLMVNYATGESAHPDADALFASGLERFGVDAVLMRDSPFLPRARVILRHAGFRPELKTLGHEIWVRG